MKHRTTILTAEAVHQPDRVSSGISLSHQRSVHGTTTVEDQGQMRVPAKRGESGSKRISSAILRSPLFLILKTCTQAGKNLQVCPYYASRTVIPGAEVITLPYLLLLQETAREALGIKLERSIVIIDEAHNIMDAVANVYATELRRRGAPERGRFMLGVYVKRFGKEAQGREQSNDRAARQGG